MGAVSTSLGEQARSIFDDIGYTVSRTDSGLRAERKWRVVEVSVLDGDAPLPETGELRCFVTHASEAASLARRLSRAGVAYDWAIVGVREDGGYEVVRPGTET